MSDDVEVRALAARILCGLGETDDEELLVGDPDLADDLAERLLAVGVRLVRTKGEAPLAVADVGDGDLSELSLACLGLCALVLGDPAALTARTRPRITVADIHQRVGEGRGSSAAYVRRAGLGPLVARGLVRVTKPAQRAADAYVTAGPALAAVDRDALVARLRAMTQATA